MAYKRHQVISDSFCCFYHQVLSSVILLLLRYMKKTFIPLNQTASRSARRRCTHAQTLHTSTFFNTWKYTFYTVTVYIFKFVFYKCMFVCVWMSRALWSSCWCFLKRKETRHCWVCVDLTWLWEQIRVTSESLTSRAGKHTLIYSNVCKCIYVCIMHVCLCAQGGQSHGCHEEPLWAHSWPGRSEISQMQRQRKSVEHPYYTGTKKDSFALLKYKFDAW